jgi:hypothetical protein
MSRSERFPGLARAGRSGHARDVKHTDRTSAEEELIAREAARDLVARYNAAGDAGDAQTVASLFVPQGVIVVEGVRYEGREAIRRVFSGVAASTGPNAEHLARLIRHFTATHRLEVVNPARVEGSCYYQVLTERGLDHWGRYEDVYVRENEVWSFVTRRVTIDGMVEGGWCARMGRAVAAGAP